MILDRGWHTRVKGVSQVEQTRMILNHAKDLGLPIDHVLVLQYLLNGNNLSRCKYFGLKQKKDWVRIDLFQPAQEENRQYE